MDQNIKKLSNVEKEFMEYIWSENEEKTLQDFVEFFSKKKWERPTISTYLHRLTQKGMLEYYQKGRYFYYKPTLSKLEYEQYHINQLMEKMCGTTLEGVIASFCGKKNFDDNQSEKLRKFLRELEND